ncbi:MAG: OsmC family protein [Sphingobacteriales bacterium]|jgi:uncharacterized OsmC-like protein|nr:OsmC family protein [Sphingobacteriales bacterium]
MTASIVYQGQLRCSCTHTQSGTVIETDAPSDNKGKGERFSPTDTVCVALATCIITTMGIKSADMNIDLAGTTISVTKHMVSDPRRIGKIEVSLQFPATLQLDEKDRLILERTGDTCPVARSLHPDIQQVISYNW